jgi:hypothetical protein
MRVAKTVQISIILFLLSFIATGKEKTIPPCGTILTISSENHDQLVIYSTHEENPQANRVIHDYVRTKYASLPEGRILADTDALRRNLADYTIRCFGSCSGNLWIRKKVQNLPFIIKESLIIGADSVKGEGLSLVCGWYNPDNPEKYIILFTSDRPENIPTLLDLNFRDYNYFISNKINRKKEGGFYAFHDGKVQLSAIPHYSFPVLTKKQMHDDFDTLYAIVNDIFPMREVNRIIYGIDVDSIFSKSSRGIDTLTSTMDFAGLVSSTISQCRGSHFWFNHFDSRDYYKGYVQDSANYYTDLYLSYLKVASPVLEFNLPVVYFEGNYFTLRDFIHNGKLIRQGSRIIRCNGSTPDEIVKANSSGRNHVSWDYKNKKFYSRDFIQLLNPTTTTSLSFEFRDPKGDLFVEKFSCDDTVSSSPTPMSDPPVVHYLKSNKVLYIRLPVMDESVIELLKKQIKSQSKNPINTIVIDIRNNPGGSDGTWMALLSMLTREKIKNPEYFGLKNSKRNLQYLSRHNFGRNIPKLKSQKIDFLNDEEFLTLQGSSEFKDRSMNVMNFKGKIYVLSENIYSSAGSLMNICAFNPSLVSLGLTNPAELGVGIDPYGFSLPNSKIGFSIEPLIDLSNAHSAVDVHHVNVEVEIHPSLNEFLDYYNKRGACDLEEFLTRYDPFFRKVIELEAAL